MKKILLLFLLILFSGCTPQYIIEEKIEKANYCQVKSDCKLIVSECPFGCYIPVNENEYDIIMDLIKNYDSKCVYSCIQIKGVDCIENKCIVNK